MYLSRFRCKCICPTLPKKQGDTAKCHPACFDLEILRMIRRSSSVSAVLIYFFIPSYPFLSFVPFETSAGTVLINF